jgi:hypothetical protein
MKVAGIKMTDPWASRVLRSKGIETERVASAPVETVVQMEQVSFEHHGPEKNYRPLLHLTGELRSILPNESLPYGIDEVTFRNGLGPIVDAFYEFDDHQLSELVSKGYFTEGFEPPANMAGIPWELPTTIDALILAPEHQGDAPVVFVTIHGQTELALDIENSGYDLAEYFENRLTVEGQQEQALNASQQGVPTRSGAINDLFAADEFTAPDAAHLNENAQRFQGLARQSSGEFPVVRTSIFEELMAEFEEKRSREAAELAARPVEYDPDTAEGVYHQRIAPGVSKALTQPSEDAAVHDAPETFAVVADALEAERKAPEKDEGLLDLSLEEPEKELDVVPVAIAPETGSSTAEQRNRRVQRTLEHERALALDNDKVDAGPELG